MLDLAGEIRQRHDGDVLIHVCRGSRDGAIVGKMKQKGALLPADKRFIVQRLDHIQFSFKPNPVELGVELE